MVQPRNEVRPRRLSSKKRRPSMVPVRREPGTTMQVLAREDLREIVRKLALGERPGITFDPLSTDR